MNNLEIRVALVKNNMKQWQLAELLHISEFTLCKKLRKEMSEEEKQEIINLITNERGISDGGQSSN